VVLDKKSKMNELMIHVELWLIKKITILHTGTKKLRKQN